MFFFGCFLCKQTYIFFSTRLFDRRKSSARLCLYWPVSRCAWAADCFYTGYAKSTYVRGITGVGGEKAGGGVAVGVLGEQVTQRWFRAVNVGGGGSGEVEETACERSHGCRRQVGRPPRNPSVAGSRTQEDRDGLSFVARQQSQHCCCFSAPPGPLVLWPRQLAWHAFLPPVLGMSSLWPFSRCGAHLLLWFAGDAGAPLGM